MIIYELKERIYPMKKKKGLMQQPTNNTLSSWPVSVGVFNNPYHTLDYSVATNTAPALSGATWVGIPTTGAFYNPQYPQYQPTLGGMQLGQAPILQYMYEVLDTIDGVKLTATTMVISDHSIVTVIINESDIVDKENIKKIRTNLFIYKDLYFIDAVPYYGTQTTLRFVFRKKIAVESLEHKLDDLLKDGEDVVVSKNMNGDIVVEDMNAYDQKVEMDVHEDVVLEKDKQTWEIKDEE
jgi:hypothetical protein